MSATDLRTPLKRARNWGSAKDGTHHFIVQRLTALVLVPLAIWAIFLALALVHSDYAHARAILHHPFAAVWLGAFVLMLFWHAQLGMQVVIEDYVHVRWMQVAAQLVTWCYCVAGVLVCLYAIVRLALA